MPCTKCDIKSKLQSNDRNLHNADLSSRIIFEKVERLGSFSKAPAGEGGDFAACVKKMKKDKGLSETSAKKLCAHIGRKKYGNKKFQNMAAKGKKESNQQNEMPTHPDLILRDYESAFEEMTRLKMSKIENYGDIEKIRDQISSLDNRVWDLKYAYKKNANDPLWEETLLKLRCGVRKKYMNQNNEQMVSNEENLIDRLIGKSKAEKIKIIKEEYPDYDEDFIKDVI